MLAVPPGCLLLSLVACRGGGLSATWLSFRFFAGADESCGVVPEGSLPVVAGSDRFLVGGSLPKRFESRTGARGVVLLLGIEGGALLVFCCELSGQSVVTSDSHLRDNKCAAAAATALWNRSFTTIEGILSLAVSDGRSIAYSIAPNLPAVWPAVMIWLLVVKLCKWNGIEEERTEHCRRQVRVGGGGGNERKSSRPATSLAA